jgi:RNA polymerase sigma-70 factor (ECF subfamily)
MSDHTQAQFTAQRALAQRISEYFKPLLNYAQRRIRGYEALGKLRPGELEPQGAVSSAVVAALKQADAAPDGTLYPWLRKHLRHVLNRKVAESQQRRRKVSLEQTIVEQADDDAAEPALRLVDVLPDPSAPLPGEIVLRAEFQRALEAMLEQLPDRWREPFLLHVRDGYTVRQIAELEDISAAEVSMRIDLARQSLRAHLTEDYEEYAASPPSETIFLAVEQIDPADEELLRSQKQWEAMIE